MSLLIGDGSGRALFVEVLEGCVFSVSALRVLYSPPLMLVTFLFWYLELTDGIFWFKESPMKAEVTTIHDMSVERRCSATGLPGGPRIPLSRDRGSGEGHSSRSVDFLSVSASG